MSALTNYASLDTALGSAGDRYFGHGYKNVEHHLVELVLERSSQPGAHHQAVAILDYPKRWSTKGSTELVPHVSSIDTIALAAALLETAVAHTRDLSPIEQAQVWVSHAKVSAGSKPEEDVRRVRVSAEVTKVETLSADTVRTTAAFRVGQLRGAITLSHPVGAGGIDVLGFDRITNLAPSPTNTVPFYLDGYKTHTLTARDIAIDTDCESITATVDVDIDTATPISGAESAWPKSISVIDAVLGAAQLSQVLLYDLDDVDRATSNTLWMRKLELVSASPDRCSRPFRGEVRVRRLSTIDRGGAIWRSADLMVTDFCGVTGSCLLAHQLPARGVRS